MKIVNARTITLTRTERTAKRIPMATDGASGSGRPGGPLGSIVPLDHRRHVVEIEARDQRRRRRGEEDQTGDEAERDDDGKNRAEPGGADMHERERQAVQPDAREDEDRGRQGERFPHQAPERRREDFGESIAGVGDHDAPDESGARRGPRRRGRQIRLVLTA